VSGAKIAEFVSEINTSSKNKYEDQINTGITIAMGSLIGELVAIFLYA
jgi:hypothetical protein